jgi:transposase-like protein
MDLRDRRTEAVGQVRTALEQGGSIRGAAAILDVPYNTLWRWSQRDGERCIPVVAELCDELVTRRTATTNTTPKEQCNG